MSAVGAGAEATLSSDFLYQLIAILVTTRIVVAVVRRLGQTDVSGEILAGLVLGPSCLGALAPGLMQRLFHPSTAGIFVGLSQIGLVMLMFQIAPGVRVPRHARSVGSARIVVISLAGLVAPFALGFATAPWFWSQLGVTPAPSLIGFRLFFAVAMSITAIPILGAHLHGARGWRTRAPRPLTIGAAAIDDVSGGWLLPSAWSQLIVRGRLLGPVGGHARAYLAVYLAFVLSRGATARPSQRSARPSGGARGAAVDGGQSASILIGLFVSAAITSNLGVFAIIGGFVVGVMLHRRPRLRRRVEAPVAPAVNSAAPCRSSSPTPGCAPDIGLLGLGARVDPVRAGLSHRLRRQVRRRLRRRARVVGESRRSALTIGDLHEHARAHGAHRAQRRLRPRRPAAPGCSPSWSSWPSSRPSGRPRR